MVQVSIQEAQKQLPDLINAVLQGEKVLIKKDEQHKIQLVPFLREKPKPQFGSAKDLIEISDDFDAPLDDFDSFRQ